ncbi:DeoR/GlpR family DNA-binding transcription regulator [uncultured Pseudokineococcus sp.]|uniref:DeoR/GlpR family DNA-binding transcription regulator n=1 Tax=uncultured Pseudokineococcus sp. TaxID=1642928 RepID=UPI0026247DE6|nr:DeoR/GlpR family DNA-binding transcription regulator [uncultured Pseudokineococcus sp.]
MTRSDASASWSTTEGAHVLAEERRQAVVDLVRVRGAVRLAELAEALGVSEMTARRDVAELAARGLVDRVHGGAMAPRATSTDEPGFAAKSALHVGAKTAIAREAAALVGPGTSVALSAGTTTHLAAGLLREVPGLTVVTNSLPVAELLSGPGGGDDDRQVLLVGGRRTPSRALVGPLAVRALEVVNVDVLLLGAHGLDPQRGLTTPTLEEAETDRALVRAARRVVVLADSSKWRVVGLATAVPLEDVDVLVTDDGLPPGARAEVAARVGRLVVAGDAP